MLKLEKNSVAKRLSISRWRYTVILWVSYWRNETARSGAANDQEAGSSPHNSCDVATRRSGATCVCTWWPAVMFTRSVTHLNKENSTIMCDKAVTAVTIVIQVFWLMTPCISVGKCHRYFGTCADLIFWVYVFYPKLRHEVWPLNSQYLSTKLHSVISHKAAVLLLSVAIFILHQISSRIIRLRKMRWSGNVARVTTCKAVG